MISLNLPPPLSVNRTRRINWAAKRKVDEWIKQADVLVMMQGRLPEAVSGEFEVTITLPSTCRIDIDNTPKLVIDYLRRLRLIVEDNPDHFKQLLIKFGEAPEGCRVTVQSTGSTA